MLASKAYLEKDCRNGATNHFNVAWLWWGLEWEAETPEGCLCIWHGVGDPGELHPFFVPQFPQLHRGISSSLEHLGLRVWRNLVQDLSIIYPK